MIFGLLLEPVKIYFTQLLRLGRFRILISTFQVLFTFSLICFSWIFFRARTVSDAFDVIAGITSKPFLLGLSVNGELKGDLYSHFKEWIWVHMRWDVTECLVAFTAVLILEVVQWMQRNKYPAVEFDRVPQVVRLCAYQTLLMIIIAFGSQPIAQKFIYFQF